MKHNCPVCHGTGYVGMNKNESMVQPGYDRKVIQCKRCSSVLNNKKKSKKK
jgi:RecJ-like exonuclease